jgi:PAS domain S-box-containing protein
MSADREDHDLKSENARLRGQLAEAESVLQAIRLGEIDAVVVAGSGEEQVFTLQGADHPYRVLVESMSEGAATLSRDGVILYANPKLAKLLEVTGTALTATRLSDWAPEPDRKILQRLIENCGSQAVSEELTMATSDGVEFPVRVSVNTLTLDDDNYFSAIITDQRLARHHAALEEAAESIRAVNERLHEADQRKDVFLATLAHELRNPLAPIRAAASVLGNPESKVENRTHASTIIERQVMHMSRLVDDLLEVSRITLGRLKLRSKSEDLSAILVAVTEGIRSSLGIQQQLSLELPEDPLRIHGDTVRLSQAITNVIENAIKYTPPDGQILIRVSREPDFAVIRVRDTGIGISQQAISRIFEMFTQEELPDQRGNSGLGIGLALTRSIVELHGGAVEAASPGFGQGSEFTLRLPLQEDCVAESSRTDELPVEAVRQEILIVDDNVDAAESLRMLLEHSGHDARTVHRGIEALTALEESCPDLVLLDIGLPDIDGYEVARRVRDRYGSGSPRMIALSGWGREEDKLRATDVGIDAYLTKPVSYEALSRLVGEKSTHARS